MADSVRQKIDELREKIARLMRENARLEAETLSDAELAASELRLRENLDLIASLASQILILEKRHHPDETDPPI